MPDPGRLCPAARNSADKRKARRGAVRHERRADARAANWRAAAIARNQAECYSLAVQDSAAHKITATRIRQTSPKPGFGRERRVGRNPARRVGGLAAAGPVFAW